MVTATNVENIITSQSRVDASSLPQIFRQLAANYPAQSLRIRDLGGLDSSRQAHLARLSAVEDYVKYLAKLATRAMIVYMVGYSVLVWAFFNLLDFSRTGISSVHPAISASLLIGGGSAVLLAILCVYSIRRYRRIIMRDVDERGRSK